MNPKQFFQFGGTVLVLVAVLGFAGVIGPTAQKSLFGALWWFDNVENWAHLVLGVAALAIAFAVPAGMHRPLALAVGVLALVVGLWSLVVGSDFLGANLENPADTILHLAVGVWALAAASRKAGGPAPAAKPPTAPPAKPPMAPPAPPVVPPAAPPVA